jgi:hypothetical protein
MNWQILTEKEMALAYDIGREVIEKDMANNHTGNNRLSKYAGYVGQIAAMKFYNALNVDDYEYDLSHNGQRLEVKTKVRSVLPNAGFSCCVYASNAEQLCDAYVFCQAMRNPDDKTKLLHGAYILGWVSREDYERRFYYVAKGDFDDDREEPADCFKIRIGELNAPQKLNEA